VFYLESEGAPLERLGDQGARPRSGAVVDALRSGLRTLRRRPRADDCAPSSPRGSGPSPRIRPAHRFEEELEREALHPRLVNLRLEREPSRSFAECGSPPSRARAPLPCTASHGSAFYLKLPLWRAPSGCPKPSSSSATRLRLRSSSSRCAPSSSRYEASWRTRPASSIVSSCSPQG